MLEIKSIDYAYKKKKNLYHDFSLQIEPNRICGLLGKNGVGKSTLLYLMCGLLFPQKGKIEYQGYDVTKRLPEVLQEMFIVPEEFELPHMTVAQYIKYNSVFYPKFSKEQFYKYLEGFGLNNDVKLDALSMGQKKKVYISFALATNVSMLLMDEPTNGLDIPGKSQFRKLMAMAMTEEKSIVISTHQVRDIDQMLDHVIILEEDGLVLNHSVAAICDKIAFVEDGNIRVDSENILYSQPSTSGNTLMIENHNQLETALDLELLYTSLLSNRERITSLFK